MLRFLRVQNLAVIESVEVEFGPGFTVLTGETGAGKSILIEALGLLLGARASADLVRSGATLATIEALFDDEAGAEIAVRREISAQGRSRAFVDGALATAATLRDLSARLVELHGQHEHHALLDPSRHLELLDGHLGLGTSVAEVGAAWSAWRAARERVARAQMDGRERTARLDLIDFQLGEIDRVAPLPGEDDELAVSRQVLAGADRLKTLCDECYAHLYDGEHAVLAGLGRVWKRIGELSGSDPIFSEYLAQRDDIKSRLEDLAQFVRKYGDELDASPERLQAVEDRLAFIERLKRKYGPTLSDVIETARRLRQERLQLTDSAETADVLEQESSRLAGHYVDVARRLSARRRAGAREFSHDLERRLGELGMANTRFEARFADPPVERESGGERGLDEAEFYVSTNQGEEMRPLARTVSGGELSRVMLALKTMRATPGQVKTMVFDEVDAGIGGRVADVVGARLRELSDTCQVLCITHLPQIAARATTQYRIEKSIRQGRTVTAVERLDDEGRVEEIARMMGGGASDAVKAGARDLLLRQEAKGKDSAKGESERRRRGQRDQ